MIICMLSCTHTHAPTHTHTHTHTHQVYSSCQLYLHFITGTVGGMGFGLISGVVAFANILQSSGGPGVVGVVNRGSQYFVLSSGNLNKVLFM